MTDTSNPLTGGERNEETERFACALARVMGDSRCENVVVLRLVGMSSVTDYFVIGSGTSDRQLRSVGDDLRKLAEYQGQGLFRSSGVESGQWVVMDFVHVVAHLFMPEVRSFYDLESLWGDAPQVEWETVTKPGEFTKILAGKGDGKG